jgi:hypothetical protein
MAYYYNYNLSDYSAEPIDLGILQTNIMNSTILTPSAGFQVFFYDQPTNSIQLVFSVPVLTETHKTEIINLLTNNILHPEYYYQQVAVGYNAGQMNATNQSIAIGNLSGQISQNNSVSIGFQSGQNNQGTNSTAIGNQAGQINQNINATCIGYEAGRYGQSSGSVAIAFQAGYSNQCVQATAIGSNAGMYTQGSGAVAIGYFSGVTGQGENAVSIGPYAGCSGQQYGSVAIGATAGYQFQGESAVAIGGYAGQYAQGNKAVAVGYKAGQYGHADYAVAIGAFAGQTGQAPFSVILNASGVPITSGTTGLFVSPIRHETNNLQTGVLTYDDQLNEIRYNSAKTFVIDHPVDPTKYLVHACLEGPEAGIYYRGKAQITNNTFSVVTLPTYVSSFGKNFNVQITPIYNGNDLVYKVSEVENGSFKVYGKNGSFFWIVYAERGTIEVEPTKNKVNVVGNGPYKYIQ